MIMHVRLNHIHIYLPSCLIQLQFLVESAISTVLCLHELMSACQISTDATILGRSGAIISHRVNSGGDFLLTIVG